MELNNTLQTCMDVKLDLRERKPEFLHMKTWTKYLVKIEAIKFFPSFVKISFLKHPNDDYTNLIVRIHIPGLKVEMTTSRTKPHAYGLFWTHNRKICCIYFAFDNKLSCEQHFQWMQSSIKSLELYRQDVLLTRRASRQLTTTKSSDTKQPEQPEDSTEMYQNLRNVGDMNHILGPLPKTPDAAQEDENLRNWLRRVSGVSEIYEEIDSLSRPSTSRRKSRLSRGSIASGIYEEMRGLDIRSDPITEENPALTSPPPLPPRSRKNTNDWDDAELKRSYTNPDQDFFKKKKHWLIFETMFGRTANKQRSTPTVISHKSTKLDEDGAPVSSLKRRDKLMSRFDFEMTRNKRNSFSSPDLTNLNVDAEDADSSSSTNNLEITQESIICSELHSQSLDQFNVSEDFLNDVGNFSMEEGDEEEEVNVEVMNPLVNISQCIKSNFNLTGCNHDVSTINLVGRSLTETIKPANDKTMNMVDGYVVMRPIASKLKDVSPPLPEKLCASPSTPQRRHVLDEEDHYKSPITFRRETEYPAEDRDSGIRSLHSSSNDSVEPIIIYENTAVILAHQSPGVRGGHVCDSPSQSKPNSPFYANIEFSFDPSPVSKPVTTEQQKAVNRRSVVDEKVASYFPNDDYQPKVKPKLLTPSPKSQKKKSLTRSATEESPSKKVSPKMTANQTRKLKIATVTSAHKSISNIYVVTQVPPPSPEVTSLSPVLRERKNSLPTESTVSKEAPLTPRGYRKYETLMTRISPSKYFEKNGAKKLDGTTFRRFASLPRFKKIDLSPLKMRINNVLQRHQTEGL